MRHTRQADVHGAAVRCDYGCVVGGRPVVYYPYFELLAGRGLRGEPLETEREFVGTVVSRNDDGDQRLTGRAPGQPTHASLAGAACSSREQSACLTRNSIRAGSASEAS